MTETSTSWGGGRAALSSTSWGGGRAAMASTSWGGGRARRAAQAVAVAVGLATLSAPAAALAAPAHSPSARVVIVGTSPAAALRSAGASDVTSLTRNVAVGRVQVSAEAGLRAEGYRVANDAPIHLADGSTQSWGTTGSTVNLRQLVGAPWYQIGWGQTVAVIDSGVNQVPALAGRVINGADFTGTGFADQYGHGTFVAGLIAGNGLDSNWRPTSDIGIAPGARIVSVKVANAAGQSTVAEVVAGLEWVIDNAAAYHITVVNLSLSAGEQQSYQTDPIDALVEAAWFSGLTVVTSAGNDGGAVLSAPGNDPYVLTVGSVGANGALSSFSDHGLTQDGFTKPEVTTIGEHVQAPLPAGSTLAAEQTVQNLPPGYGQLSGTSMSAAVASGVAALVQSVHRSWSPGQVKQALEQGATGGYASLQVVPAEQVGSPADADANLTPSALIKAIYAKEFLHLNVIWSDVIWSDVTWSDVIWSDVTWSDVIWSDVVWSDVTWSDVVWSDLLSTNG